MLKITALHYSSGKQSKLHSEWCFLYFLIGTDFLLTTQTASCLSTLKKLYNLTAGTAVFFFSVSLNKSDLVFLCQQMHTLTLNIKIFNHHLIILIKYSKNYPQARRLSIIIQLTTVDISRLSRLQTYLSVHSICKS